jgi:exodeoxyribonuclease V alpha subunit
VLSDLVEGYADRGDSPVVSLHRNFRATHDIHAAAEALRAGDADAVLAALRAPSDEVELVETTDVGGALRRDTVRTATGVHAAAVEGRAEDAVTLLDEHRLLCAHREGAFGVRHWNRQVEQWLAEETGQQVQGWYVGRPLLVTSNDYALNVYNGETGVVVRMPDGRVRAVVAGAGGLHDFAPGRLDAVETMHAMTIHKSQGSQADEVTVLLPQEDSRLLTRELFYTAVTRAKERVRVVASEAALRTAIERRAVRASGLARRLRE